MKSAVTILLTLVLVTSTNWTQASIHATAVAQTRDTWRSVETNNLFVIGNTDPETLRQVAGWLEFFHAAFSRVISRSVVDSTVPTRVVVFRDEASFLAFKPLYQGKPLNLAGYFQPGDDVNYIAILLDRSGRQRDSLSTAFHEYVHLHLRQNVSNAPLWLNEGLAEFYSSLQFSGNEAIIGAPITSYISLLRTREMLPLPTLLSIGNDSPHYNEQDKTGIFYGESWALVHYLMMGGHAQRQDQFKQFLQLIARGDRADKALESAFGMSVDAVEKEFQNYIQRGEFNGQRMALAGNSQSYASYTAMQRTSLTDAEANYYLGDLLLHIGHGKEAERYFEQAVSLDSNLALANASLGLLRVEQRRYPEAKKYLQKASASSQNYLVHYLYAYTLSRDGLNTTTDDLSYSRDQAALMRDELLKSIKLAPNFSPAYYLLALVDLVSEERLDEAEAMVTKAKQIAPSKRGYSLLLAQIHIRRSNAEAARQILEPLTRDSDASVRTDAQELLDSLSSSARNNTAARTKVQISDDMIAEPESQNTSRGIVGGGGSTSSSSIRDGRTIDTSGSMPSLDEVLAKYVQASGGAAAINAVHSRVTKGTLDVIGISRGGSFEVHAQAPNKTLTVIDAHPLGVVKLGFNGKTGWANMKTGMRVLKGVELGTVQRDSEFYAQLRLKNVYAKVSLLGKSKIGYRDVYVIELQPAAGPSERMFLDAETYLPVRVNTFRPVGTAMAPVEVYYDDWRDVDGIKFPFRISETTGRQTLVFSVKEIKHNVAVNATVFDPPVK